MKITWVGETSMSSFWESPPLAAAIRSCCCSIILAAAAAPLPPLIWCCLSLEAKITDSSKWSWNPTLLLSVLDGGVSLNKSLGLAEEELLFVGKGRFVGGLRSQGDLGSAHEQEGIADSICSRKSSFDDELGSKWEFWICWFWRSCRGICEDGFMSEFIPCISLLQGRIFLKRQRNRERESWGLGFEMGFSSRRWKMRRQEGLRHLGLWGWKMRRWIRYFFLPSPCMFEFWGWGIK